MKLAYLSGSVMAVALIVTSSTPTYARGGGHGGHGGGHGGHGGHAHAHASAHRGGHAHTHAFAHGGHGHAFAHRTGFAGRHFAANRGFAHNYAGWNHGWGRGWGRGWGLGWGRGWRSGYWGGRYVGSYWPAYLAAGIVNPSYYYNYLTGSTTTAVPAPVAATQYGVTNVVQPLTPSAVPGGAVTTASEDAAPPVAK